MKGEVSGGSIEERLISNTVSDLKNSKYVDSIYLMTENDRLAKKLGVLWIDRTEINDIDQMSINALMKEALDKIEGEHVSRSHALCEL